MVLKDIALLASNTSRTKAYLQQLIKGELAPSLSIIYTDNKKELIEEKNNYKKELSFGKYFNKDIPLLLLLENYNLDYILVEDKDINSELMMNTISHISQTYLIYSGYGGYILKPELFKLGKKFIHVHAGILPQYRGSTTAYYSILKEGKIGATAIFLNEQIDQGQIIAKRKFPIPREDVDIDYIYEPYIRAKVLLEVLFDYVHKQCFSAADQNEEDSEIYFIIHPVLKHLALNKIREDIDNG